MEKNDDRPEALLWIDFETTGIDRFHDLPLEIGMRCTDMRAEQTFGSLTRIIRPASLNLLAMSPVVFSMHTDNGLLFELVNSTEHNDGIGVVANAVEEFLDSLSEHFRLTPSGTNVDFDIDFLRRLNIDPAAWLNYRKLDLSTFRKITTIIGGDDPYQGDTGPHRAKQCIARDIHDYNAMLDQITLKTERPTA